MVDIPDPMEAESRIMETVERWKNPKKDSRSGGLKPCFMPKTGRHLVIYAVSVVDHKGVVKIGQTSNWKRRRKSYANWNLRFGDGIEIERVFLITEEYIDLLALEAEILDKARSMFEPHHGLEWFKADMDDVCRLIDEVMCDGGVSYVDG